MNTQMKVQQGFTLIELMIVVAIIGILAAIAVPAYQEYTLKAKFSEVVNSVSGIKAGIEVCFQNGDCSDGAGGIVKVAFGYQGLIPDQPVATTYLASVAVAGDGTITATATAAGGLNGQTYILTPTGQTTGQIIWDATAGTCRTATPKLC